MAAIDHKIGSLAYEDVLIGTEPAAKISTVKLAASKGVLKRGTVLTGTAGGEMSPVSAALSADGSTANPVYVLAEETDTGDAPVVTVAYKTGNFARGRLVTDGSYELTAADYEYMRLYGIQTEDVL